MNAQRTLMRFYVYAAIQGLQFGWTTWLAFVVARGGNPGWAESAFHLAILLGEVPTGAVADLLGRRASMLVGLAIGAAASFSYLAIDDTLTACLVLGLSGLGGTFLSGAADALLYETAAEVGGPDLARRAMARSSAITMGFLAAAPVIAGYLYQWNDLAPFISRGMLSLIAMLVVWGMAEKTHAPEPAAAGAGARPSIWGQTRAAVRVVISHPAVLGMILFAWVYNAVGAMVGQFGQAYFPQTGLTMVAAGFVFAGARLLSSGGSALAERVNSTWAGRLLRFGPLGQALAYIGMGLGGGWPGAGFYLVGELLDGGVYPTLQAQLNEAIPSAQRATILSLQSAGFSMLMVVAFPAASYMPQITDIYLVTGAAGVVAALLWILWRRR